MKKIKTYYTFLFYALYKSMEIAKPAFLTDFKAMVALFTLEVWFLFTPIVYLTIITKTDLFPENFLRHPSFYILIGGLTSIKIFVFIYKNRWRNYISKFDTWPKDKIRRWKIVAWIFMFSIVANFVLSMYFLYQIDWSLYR